MFFAHCRWWQSPPKIFIFILYRILLAYLNICVYPSLPCLFFLITFSRVGMRRFRTVTQFTLFPHSFQENRLYFLIEIFYKYLWESVNYDYIIWNWTGKRKQMGPHIIFFSRNLKFYFVCVSVLTDFLFYIRFRYNCYLFALKVIRKQSWHVGILRIHL